LIRKLSLGAVKFHFLVDPYRYLDRYRFERGVTKTAQGLWLLRELIQRQSAACRALEIWLIVAP